MKKGDANIINIRIGDKVVFKNIKTIEKYKKYNIIYGVVTDLEWFHHTLAKVSFFNHKGIEVARYLARIDVSNTELIYYNEQGSQS